MEVSIGKDNEIWLVIYDDIEIVYDYQYKDNRIGHFCWAQIDNEAYLFGNKKIAVGMSREQVEKILKNAKRPRPAVEGHRYFDLEGKMWKEIAESYYDNMCEYGLGFVYDENDCVKYIYIWKGL